MSRSRTQCSDAGETLIQYILIWNCPFCILRGCQSNFFLYNDVFLDLKVIFILEYSADPDEMPPYAAFNLGLHWLPKSLFTGI